MSARKDPQGNPLPTRLYWKHGRYWYVHRNQWQALSGHYPEAMARYSRLVAPGSGMSDLVNQVMQRLTGSDKLKPRTVEQYKLSASKIKDAFVEFEPHEVKQTHVAEWHDSIAAEHPNAANRALTVIRIVFNYAVKWGKAEYNPALGVTRAEEAKRTRYLEDWEYQAIRSQARPWLQLLMDVLYLTGQRVGDVLKLRRQDVSAAGVYFLQEKSGKRLQVTMTPELHQVIEQAKRVHGKIASQYVFHPRGKGEPYSYFSARDAYRRACEAAGVEDTTLHDLRAKSLTDAKKQGQDATALAGHSSPSMTARYLRLRETQIVKGPTILRQSKDKTA